MLRFGTIYKMAGDKKFYENFIYQKKIVKYRKKLLKIAMLKSSKVY